MSNLRFASLNGANFTSANARGVDFERASMQNAVLDGADFRGSNFQGVNFAGATITPQTQLQGANFAGANIEGMSCNGKPVSYTQLQNEFGVQGVGLNVAAERAQAQGLGHFASTDSPDRAAAPTMAEAMRGFSTAGIQVAEANPAALFTPGMSPSATPAEAMEQAQAAKGQTTSMA